MAHCRGDRCVRLHPSMIVQFSRCHSGVGVGQPFGLLEIPVQPRFILPGLLIVDRPRPADLKWLRRVESIFGEYQLVPMTATGERGIVCRMQIEPESLPHLRQCSSEKGLRSGLPWHLYLRSRPIQHLSCTGTRKGGSGRARSPPRPNSPARFASSESFGCRCLAAETDIEGRRGKPVRYRPQLIQMPAAPQIRLAMVNVDDPAHWARVSPECSHQDQAALHAGLASQDCPQGVLHKRRANGGARRTPPRYPHRDSNTGLWLRRPTLYPLSYGGLYAAILPYGR
jgi:hypothetical protein